MAIKGNNLVGLWREGGEVSSILWVKSLDDVRAFYHRLLSAGMKIDRTVTHGIACSEAYSLSVERAAEGAHEADGPPFSASCYRTATASTSIR